MSLFLLSQLLFENLFKLSVFFSFERLLHTIVQHKQVSEILLFFVNPACNSRCCCCLPTPMTLASGGGGSDVSACGPPASFSVHLAISAVTPAGSVHKSRDDNVVRMWVVQLYTNTPSHNSPTQARCLKFSYFCKSCL